MTHSAINVRGRVLNALRDYGPQTSAQLARAVRTTTYYVTYVCEEEETIEHALVDVKGTTTRCYFLRGDERRKLIDEVPRIRYHGPENLAKFQVATFIRLLSQRGRLDG